MAVKNLRVRMTILIVLVVLVSTGLLWAISYQRAEKAMSSQLETSYSLSAEKTALELTEWINTNATILNTLAAEIEVTGIWAEGYDAFHKYLNDSCNRLNKNGYIYDIYFTYPNNTMACATDFVTDGSVDYVHDRAWYTDAVRTGDMFYSTPYLDSDTGMPIITISKAVTSGGEVQGVLAADIFVDVLVNIINGTDVARNSYAFLVDQNMGMIVHPNKAYEFDDAPHGMMDVPDVPFGYEDVIDNIRSGSRETVYLTDYDGVARGVVVSRMENTGWYFGIATSRDELMRGVSSLIRGFLIAAVVAVVIGGILAFLLTRLMDKLSKQQQSYEAQVLKLEKQAADKANEAKSRFLADMSHEIRTPINAVLGMNEMIQRESLQGRSAAGNAAVRDAFGNISVYSGHIRSAGANLLSIVNDILDLSKVEAGRMEIAENPYTLSSLLNDVSNMVFFRAKEKGLQFIVDVDETLPDNLYGDKVRVRQVITNVLTNAVKYTHEGSVRLTVRGRADGEDVPGPKLDLTVTVSDTGIGIRPEDMDKVFDSFQRVDLGHNSTVEGTGLGLAISRKLMEMMGGEIGVESTYGEGSTFTIRLPQRILSREPVGDIRARFEQSVLAAGEYRESFQAPDARILIVDDTRINLMVASGLLKNTQMKIDTAAGGPQAVDMALATRYDLIFMDQRMPGMDGTEAARRIREAENSPNRNTPVVCMTADAVIGARERYIAEGFDDYLPKPVEGADLEKTLITWLPKEKVFRITPEDAPPAEAEGQAGADSAYAPLRACGIRPESGLRFCQNSDGLYRSVLVEYARSAAEKTESLRRYYDDRDWTNYAILVHSVKSSSRTIGAEALADLAAGLEKAAKEAREEAVSSGHEPMLARYEATARAILDAIPEAPEEQEDVIEFSPE